jgi:hypothetical protein
MLRVIYKNAQFLIIWLPWLEEEISVTLKEGSQRSIGGLKRECVCVFGFTILVGTISPHKDTKTMNIWTKWDILPLLTWRKAVSGLGVRFKVRVRIRVRFRFRG